MNSNMVFKFTVFVKCQLAYRDTIGAILRHVCNNLEAQGEPANLGHQVLSAFNEAFNNLVSHGGDQVDEKDVAVTIMVKNKQLIIEMNDDAKGFKPPTRIPAIKNPRESGMGLLIIKEFMDFHDYKHISETGVNTLRMVRNLSIEPSYA